MEHSPGNLQKGGIICYHLMMDVGNQLLQEMNGLGSSLLPFTVFSTSDVGLVSGKPMHIQTREDANHDLELHSLHTLFTLKFKIHQLHAVRLY